jgi:DNA polymerase-3 subunit gamma/tau
MGLYQKYRPTLLSEIIGQPTAVQQLRKMDAEDSVPHAILMSGPSGCGKTTAARIVAKLVDAAPTGVTEVNCALSNGVDVIREIESKMHLKPLGGKARVYILDEFHAVTPAGQRGMLKLLEDTPAHIYFILCTTNPEKLEKPVVTRCVNIKFNNLSVSELKKLIQRVATEEQIHPGKMPDPAVIATAADGSARKALVLLEQIIASDSAADWHEILETGVQATEYFDMVRDLYAGRFTMSKWGPKLKELGENDVEGLRMCILSYGATILCGGRNEDAMRIMELFTEPFFSSKKPGFILNLAKCQ